jgi:hypothetical protein
LGDLEERERGGGGGRDERGRIKKNFTMSSVGFRCEVEISGGVLRKSSEESLNQMIVCDSSGSITGDVINRRCVRV